jgi:hypothetical protein
LVLFYLIYGFPPVPMAPGVDKKVGLHFLTAEIAELAEKIRGILSVLSRKDTGTVYGLRGEMIIKAHEHSHSHGTGKFSGMRSS